MQTAAGAPKYPHADGRRPVKPAANSCSPYNIGVDGDRYFQIVSAVDAEFERNRRIHGERIHCRPGCFECCHHVFAISSIEASVIEAGLRNLDKPSRSVLEERALDYLQRRILEGERIPCPALENGICSIYEFRPLMCHKFGMPLYNPDKPDRIFACELNFQNGDEIDDPDLIPIQTSIHEAWKNLKAGHRAAQPDGVDRLMTVAHAILQARPD